MEHIHFRLIQMPCCNTLYCHVNPRLPNYCPECGARCFIQVKSGAHTLTEYRGWLTEGEKPPKLKKGNCQHCGKPIGNVPWDATDITCFKCDQPSRESR